MRRILAAALLLPALALAQAQSSFQTIGYQGQLKKNTGEPERLTVTITFRIYEEAHGGTELWSEEQDVTPNAGGFYAIFLGSTSPEKAQALASIFDGSDRYLELQIRGEDPLTPRQQIASVPYALTAKNVNGGPSGTVTTGSVTVSGAISVPTPTAAGHAARQDMAGQDGMVTTSRIADGSVTRAKLAPVPWRISESSGTFGTGATSYVDVTNLTVDITTTGRPVMVFLQPDGMTEAGANSNVGSGTSFALLRDGAIIAEWGYMDGDAPVPKDLLFLDVRASAGSHTYRIQAKNSSPDRLLRLWHHVLVAHEL